MSNLVKSGKNGDMQDLAGKIAIGATGVAITAAAVAIGAALLSDDKTRNKIVRDGRQAMDNFREAIYFIRRSVDQAKKTFEGFNR